MLGTSYIVQIQNLYSLSATSNSPEESQVIGGWKGVCVEIYSNHDSMSRCYGYVIQRTIFKRHSIQHG